MNRQSTSWSLVLFLLSVAATAQEAPTAIRDSGVIRHVTLYRDRALITRDIKIPAGGTLRAIEVPDLPEFTVTDSVFAEGDERTVVRAVRVSLLPAAESNREVVREFDRKLEELHRQHATTQHALDVLAKNLESLSQMVNFATVTSHSDQSRGVLNADTLIRAATFLMERRRELSDEQFAAQRELADLKKQIEQVNSQRQQATAVRSSGAYEAKIFVETAAGNEGKVQLRYLVGGCEWSPQYIIRGRTSETRFDFRFSALIQQMSGEDWRDVELTLSTASPTVNATGPALSPLRIAVVDPKGDPTDPFRDESPAALTKLTGDLAILHRSLRQRQIETEAGDQPDQLSGERDTKLNLLAGKIQQIELQAESKSWRAMAPDVNDCLDSQVYALSRPISLNSRRDQQLVAVIESSLEGEMYYVATPLLSTFGYREAQMTNSQPRGLLAGPATVYLDDRFVGRTQIPSTASGQLVTIGFGADQQIRTRRELLAKKDEVKGGNRHLSFSYRLVLANFRAQPIAVRLIDRLPMALDSEQLNVQLETPQEPISKDGLYERLERPTGVLRWDLTIPENRHGSRAFDLHYSYTLEFDRNRVPTSQHVIADIEQELDYHANAPGFGGGGFGGGFGGAGGFGGSGISAGSVGNQ